MRIVGFLWAPNGRTSMQRGGANGKLEKMLGRLFAAGGCGNHDGVLLDG